jgi:hypothetical protein
LQAEVVSSQNNCTCGPLSNKFSWIRKVQSSTTHWRSAILNFKRSFSGIIYCYVTTSSFLTLPLYCYVTTSSFLTLPLYCYVTTSPFLTLPLYCYVTTSSFLTLPLYCKLQNAQWSDQYSVHKINTDIHLICDLYVTV